MVHIEIDGDHAETNTYYQQGGNHLSVLEEHLSVVERANPQRSKRVQLFRIIKIWIMNTQEKRFTLLSKSMEDARSKETVSCTTARVTKRRTFPQDASLERLKWAAHLLR